MMQTRNTLQRQIVFDTVQKMHTHPTADEVYESIAQKHPTISKATVYRNLRQLADKSQIRRVPVAAGADRFDFRMEPHHHARCRLCGTVYDIFVPEVDRLLEQVHSTDEMQIDGFELLFVGTCRHCAEK